MLEGGVRRSSGRVRVTAQLVDALSGKHLWAERYDRQLEDIFAVQDEITAVIVNTLVPTLTHQHLLWRSEQDAASLNAYDHQLRAMDMFWKLTRLSTAATREEAQKAISLDEGLARSHALVAWTHLFEGANRWGGIVQLDAFRSGHAAATTSVAIDDREPWGHAALGFVNLYGFHAHDRAVTCLRRSVELNPNSSYFRGWYSMGLNYAGRPVDALKEIELAIRLNPHHPPIYLLFLGRVLFTLGRYDEALPHLTRLVYAMPDYSAGLSLVAACMAALDRHDEARGVVRQILESEPSFDLSAIAHSAPYRDPTTYEAYRNLLRDSGMPE